MVLLMSLFISFKSAASDVDVYEPKSKPVATVVFLHGGAWLGGDKKDYKELAPTFTSAGLRFVSANYRLAPKYKHPAPVDDLEGVLSRGKYENVFLVGHSAGAHLIAFWNAAHANPAVKGFIGLEGIYDLTNLVKVWPGYRDWFVSAEFGSDASKWPAASPATLTMKSKVPWLVLHSAKDELVDAAQSSDFVKHLESQKIPAQLVELKSESHFGAVSSLGNASSDAAKAVLKFISQQTATPAPAR